MKKKAPHTQHIEMDNPDEMDSLEFHKNCLIESVLETFDGPIYRGVDDLEAVRNSDSPTVAVVAQDQPMVFYVSRETFLNEQIGMEADDLFEHAGVPHVEMEALERSSASGHVNGPAFAQQSVRSHLKKMQPDEELDLEAFIWRLRDSKEYHRMHSEWAGRKNGRFWAVELADWGDFCRLESMRDEIPDDVKIDWVVSLLNFYREKNWSWEDLIDPETSVEYGADPMFVRAFIRGALEVWYSTKSEVLRAEP